VARSNPPFPGRIYIVPEREFALPRACLRWWGRFGPVKGEGKLSPMGIRPRHSVLEWIWPWEGLRQIVPDGNSPVQGRAYFSPAQALGRIVRLRLVVSIWPFFSRARRRALQRTPCTKLKMLLTFSRFLSNMDGQSLPTLPSLGHILSFLT
jgi:hypothetical protein